ncbi:hypothetical protein EVAR_30981_1 [Eumeta japonica]|uniref:RNA-directed DNA polymerase from transposon X-element n=1 Tax=Eumeta variegata TaxID=151549 RepID=A0A4C1W8V0_EUMVA|nr:hypothetical protein EVAR_30981_1 [Eumeta japonica]
MKEVRNENCSDLMVEMLPSRQAYWGLAKVLKTEGAVPTPTLKKPIAWKEAVVIVIPKQGKPRELPASYRPISLLSVLSKLLKKKLNFRLSEHLIGEQMTHRRSQKLYAPPVLRALTISKVMKDASERFFDICSHQSGALLALPGVPFQVLVHTANFARPPIPRCLLKSTHKAVTRRRHLHAG